MADEKNNPELGPTQAELEEAAARQKHREQQEQSNRVDYSMYVPDNY